MPTPKFQVGRSYTHKQTCKLGGNPQTYLPAVNGTVVAGRFDPKLNPRAPEVVFADGDVAVRDGMRLWHQDDRRIPVFIKDGVNRWRYAGVYQLVDVVTTDLRALRAAMKESGRDWVELILRFEPVDVRSRVAKPPLGAGNLEGNRRLVQHYRFDRSPENRDRALEIYGYQCAVCGFDFERFYGPRGRGVAEVHHTIPLSRLAKATKVDPVRDMRPVCPNCHRMLHLNGGLISIDELKKHVQASRRRAAR